MRICCFAFLCFGDKEEDSIATNSFNNFYCRNKEGSDMREGRLGNVIEEMDSDDSELGFWANLRNGGVGGSGLGVGVDGERGNEDVTNEMFNRDGEMNQESENFLLWMNDVKTRRADGASGSEEIKVDVNLNLGLGGEPSSSTSMIATGRDTPGRDSQNKRPKVHSFTL